MTFLRVRPCAGLALAVAAVGDATAIRKLVSRGADPNYQGRLVVRYSLLFPFRDESWEDVTRDSLTPLLVAAGAGHESAVVALLEAGARPEEAAHFGAPGRTALAIAARAGRPTAKPRARPWFAPPAVATRVWFGPCSTPAPQPMRGACRSASRRSAWPRATVISRPSAS